MTFTLSLDVGGSGIKAMVLNALGEPVSERSRVETPYPCPPEVFLEIVRNLASNQPAFDRISVGFPAMVRGGNVFRATAYSRAVKSGPRDPEMFARWNGYPLQDKLTELFDTPTLVINDADMQGCAVVTGIGMEFVVTLGTGVGTGVFYKGHMLPHMELSHGAFAGVNIDIALGDAQRKQLGNKLWRPLVTKALIDFDTMLFPDKIFIGGGNAKHLREEDLLPSCEIVPNSAGLVGGVRAWDLAT
jgi:polyphosphate glucokinase